MHVGANPLGSVLVGSHLWVPNIDDSTISVVDTKTSRVLRTFDGPPEAPVLAHAAGPVFATSTGSEIWRYPTG